MEFRAEFFSLLNHPNFALPNASVFAEGVNGGGSVCLEAYVLTGCGRRAVEPREASSAG